MQLRRAWPALFLAALALVMLAIRAQTYDAHLGGERPYFIGPDAYYHYREVLAAVASFPDVPRWDPWTHFPEGTWTGQFGTAFDLVAALAVLALHGPDATPMEVARVLGVVPAVLAALLVVPLFLLARRLVGTPGAVVACVVLALLPGQFLDRSVVAYADHHVAEVLTLALSTLALLVAVERGDAAAATLRASPRTAWRPLLWAVLAGAALAVQVNVWSPALLFVALLAAWVVLVVLVDAARGRDTLGVAAAGAVAFGSAGLMLLPTVETWRFLGYFADLNDSNVAPYDVLHVAGCLLPALGIVVAFLVAEAARRRRAPRWVAPTAVAGAGVLLLLAVVLAGTGGEASQALSWVSGTGGSRTIVTIAEAQPAALLCLSDKIEGTTLSYCLTRHVGLVPLLSAGVLLALAIAARNGDRRDLLLLLLGAVVLVASRSQVRFTYYLALTAPLLLGWVAARVVGSPTARRAVTLLGRRKAGGGPGYDHARVAAVAVGLVLVVPVNLALGGASTLAWLDARADVDPLLVDWTDAAEWLREATPDAGMDLAATYAPPPEGERHAYPPEAYGVLAWWENGHILQVIGRRPPVANPFQQGATEAALWLTETDPAAADARLDALGRVRYVIVDERTATTFLGAVLPWAHAADPTRPNIRQDLQAEAPYAAGNATRNVSSMLRGPYADTMLGRLYDGDGRGLDGYRLVWEAPRDEVIASQTTRGRTCIHRPVRECPVPLAADDARAYAPGTLVPLPGGAVAWDLHLVSPVKVYERVPGARLVGHAAPGEEVVASVTLLSPRPDGARTFLHEVRATADEDGRFEVRFPYATTPPLAPADGGTLATVRADGPALVRVGDREVRVDVPDAAVLRGDAVEVPP